MQILLEFLQYSSYGVKATSLGPKKILLGILNIGLSAKPTSWVFVICEAASADDAIKTGTLLNRSIIIGPCSLDSFWSERCGCRPSW
ncbi:hypothetical protein FXO38_36496 [Capsicum annuum]|nr:hypothetical protein FXO38_36496 [Capsicum annuum]